MTVMKKILKIKLTFVDNTPDPDAPSAAPLADAQSDVSEFVTEAEYTEAEYADGERCDLVYKESPDLGMGNCTIKITWLKDDPQVVTVIRSGEVETVMSFEPGRRHISAYSMTGMSFELCTRTLKCKNTFDGELGGEIYVDYVVEVRGGFAGRRKMRVCVLP